MTENTEKLAILALLLLLSFPQIFPLQQINPTSVMILPSSETYAGEIISINSDSDFAIVAASLGFPGNGSSGNPYIIVDLDIDYIRIEDTTVYFEIRRCYLAPTTDPRSIDFDTVSNGLVDSCVIENRPNGIKVAASHDIIISNNTLRSISVESISVDYSDHCTIIDNYIPADGLGAGVGCYKSYYLDIDNNTMTDCRDGLYLPFSEYLNITNNHVTNCGYGLLSSGGFDIHVENNTFVNAGVHLNSLDPTMTFINNTVNGLELGVFTSLSDETLDANQFGQLILWLSYNVTIVNGTFSHLSHCIELLSCWDCTIENVTFANSAHGIWMDSSTDCTIRNVTLRDIYSWPLYAEDSHNLSLLNSTIESDGDPILLFESLNCTLIGNSFFNSYISFKRGVDRYSYGSNSIDYFIHTIEDNTIDELLLGYFHNETGIAVDLASYAQLIFVNCTDSELGPATLTNRSIQIHVFHSQSIGLLNCDIESYVPSSIMFIQSPNCSITDCEVKLTSFIIHESERFALLRNTMSSEYGVFIHGVRLEASANSLIESNLLEGPYIEAILILTSSNVTVSENELESTYFGLIVEGDNSLISGNRIAGSTSHGLTVVRSTNCTIENNDCQVNSQHGLIVDECTNSTISNNNAIANRIGLRLSEAINCTVDSNRFEQNSDDGIYMDGSIDCTIVNNDILANRDYGIYVQTSSNNSFYLNRIGWNSDDNALDNGADNTWDNGVDTGNLWSDYSGSGVYDVPGTAQSVDRFPGLLMASDEGYPFLNSPNDITYELGATGNTIYWQASDSNPSSYQLERNGAIIESGAWETDVFAISIDGLELGVYNYTLTVCDEGGLCTSDSVLVTVIPQSPTLPDDFPFLLLIVGGGLCVVAVIVILWIRVKK